MSGGNMNNLVWFRNDLRIRDNESLHKAIVAGKPIIGLYCFDKRQFEADKFGFRKTAKYRAKFLLESVNDLKAQLAPFNIPLVITFGYPEEEIPKLNDIVPLHTIFLQNEWTSEEKSVEQSVRTKLPEVKFEESNAQFLVNPDDFFEFAKNVPNSFTSFRKKIEKYIDYREEYQYKLPKQSVDFSKLSQKEITLAELGFEDFEVDRNSAFPFKGGETAGLERVANYVFQTKKVGYYKKTRNGLVGLDYSTKFSSWLANGSLSPITIYHQIKQYEQEFGANDSTYWVIFELLWRDFFKFISMKHGNSIFQKGGIQQRDIHWQNHNKTIQQWINGETSCDFVNANMIELKKTGWMSNRGRQNVASFLTKELHQDWRIGANYFESMLIDYDVHSNYGNWMYVAGVGNDSRDRKFNTQLQADKYDTNGKFRKIWLQPQLF